ncbi:MAG TPA: antitoxin VbhA family protein [Noviherbaspirillum sp.]|nr:antitoxin VbhA family protein [Noviherbaspirillum sp.]
MKLNDAPGVCAMANNDEYYVQLADSNETWQQIMASWEIEGIEATRDNKIIAGKMIAGELSLNDALTEIRARHGVRFDSSQAQLIDSVH